MQLLNIIILSILLPALSISGISIQDSGMTYVRNGTLDRILIDGGYIKDEKYHFFVTDHLGSVRAVMDEDGKVSHTVHYYPFGEEFGSEDGAGSADSAAQPYRFNAKEDQSFTGVPLLDYGARFYNPALARWTTLDPLAEKYYNVSPYTFCNLMS